MPILSRNVVWAGAALVAGAAAVAIAQQPGGVLPAAAKAPAADQLRTADPLGVMLSEAKAAYARLRDYTCTYTRQERVRGILGAEQVGTLKVRVKPYSVAVRIARPQDVAGQEASFVDGARAGKVKYRAGGKAGTSLQLLWPDDPKALADTRHPVTEVGVGPTIDRVAAIATREKAAGHAVEVYPTDFQFAGKNVTRYELTARRAHAHRYAYRCLVYVDRETKLPVRFEAYDAPKPGTTVGDLLEAYSYTDVKPNVGLGDSAFE